MIRQAERGLLCDGSPAPIKLTHVTLHAIGESGNAAHSRVRRRARLFDRAVQAPGTVKPPSGLPVAAPVIDDSGLAPAVAAPVIDDSGLAPGVAIPIMLAALVSTEKSPLANDVIKLGHWD